MSIGGALSNSHSILSQSQTSLDCMIDSLFFLITYFCSEQMVRKGKMHGYMRMYWAKKILEWTPDPREALRSIIFSFLKIRFFDILFKTQKKCFLYSYRCRIAIYLNDKYEIDGRDPNGYVGCAWAIGTDQRRMSVFFKCKMRLFGYI